MERMVADFTLKHHKDIFSTSKEKPNGCLSAGSVTPFPDPNASYVSVIP
jgi:hypothetical protein